MQGAAARRGAACFAVLCLAGLVGCADTAQRAAPRGPAASPASSPTATPIATAGIPKSQRRPFTPAVVRLPSGAAVPVDPAGVDGSGVLAVPDDVNRAGWWTGGARAGDPFGGVVIAGHVDSARLGIGLMAELADVVLGAEVVLEGSGERRRYRIESLTQVAKARLSADLGVFDQVVPERLVLITCGGEFDPVARHYADNLVVVAAPVER